MSTSSRFVVAAVLDVPVEAVPAFRRYEEAVLPLLERHDGVLERRLRNDDGTVEVHLLSFGSRAAYRSYLDDPERVGHRSLLAGGTVSTRVLESLTDV